MQSNLVATQPTCETLGPSEKTDALIQSRGKNSPPYTIHPPCRDIKSTAVDALEVPGAEVVRSTCGFFASSCSLVGFHLEVPMKNVVMSFTAMTLLAVVGGSVYSEEKKDDKKVPAALNFKMKKIDGKEVDLSAYKGKVVLMVNVASKCGLTPQYEALEGLHEKFSEKGLAVLGFPANEFGAQEPGSDEEISKFCKDKFSVKFDMFSKVVVKGEGQCPLYKYLTSKETSPQPSGEITWNFEKFLIGRNGEIVARFSPRTKPDSEEVLKAIEAELAKK
jgi:glutathione peroxidase